MVVVKKAACRPLAKNHAKDSGGHYGENTLIHYRAQVLRRLTAVASLNETWAIPAAHTVGRFRKGSALAEKAEKVFLTHMVRVVDVRGKRGDLEF